MKNQKGFSLIELLIVVVIIGIIAAIAIPNLLAARRSANESSAISTLRTTHGAQVTYQATSGNGNFGDFTELRSANLVDEVLGDSTTPQKAGYDFAMEVADATGGESADFAALAEPVNSSGITATGTRSFGIGAEGVIYAEDATATSMAVTGGTLDAGTALPLGQQAAAPTTP